MQGSIGVVMSHKSSSTLRLQLATYWASLTLTVVLPLPGLLHMTSTWFFPPARPVPVPCLFEKISSPS
ncbi:MULTISPECIES: hypothetical protein [Paenibacillus]|uniref:hypothetical protein n=1 Tax=Paenibacillus TaxID=44249 RepID=UPI0030FA0821